MSSVPMPAPLYKYLAPRFAEAMLGEGTVKVGTLSEYRALDDRERGDGHEGELTLVSPAGRHAYGGSHIPPPLRHPGIQIDSGGLVTEGEGAVTIGSRIADLFIYCTTEVYDRDYAGRFGNGDPIDCVRIDQPEQFFSALDAALRDYVATEGFAISMPRWGRCEYKDRRHNWEREDLPATWLLKPTRYQGQREIRVRWEAGCKRPLDSVILKAPAIIPYCTLLRPVG